MNKVVMITSLNKKNNNHYTRKEIKVITILKKIERCIT